MFNSGRCLLSEEEKLKSKIVKPKEENKVMAQIAVSAFVEGALNIAQVKFGVPTEIITIARPFYHAVAKRVTADFSADKKREGEKITKAVEWGIARVSVWYKGLTPGHEASKEEVEKVLVEAAKEAPPDSK